MVKLYNRIYFSNGTTPALNETNLNAMSKAIDDIDNRVIDLAAYPTISVGTVTTLPPTASATVVNVGTPIAPVFDFGIPRGVQGEPGDMDASVYDPTDAVANAGGIVAYIDDVIADALSASY